MLLKDKIALVVGATSGIGRGIAELAAKEGAYVILTGRRAEQGEAVAKGIEAAGGKAEFVKMDVLDLPGCYAAIDGMLARHGRLDVLFYNAGVAMAPASIDDATEEKWDKIVGTNLRSAFFILQKVLPALEQSKGNAVMTSSTAAVADCYGGQAIYCASKAGLNQMVRVVAYTVAKRGVRVNCVMPGTTMTDIFAGADEATMKYMADMCPMGVVMDPVDVAQGAVFLASDRAHRITGHALAVDAGGLLK